MKILTNGRFIGGGIVVYILAGVAFTLQQITDLSGLLSFGLVVAMFALVPIILLATKKAYIGDKRLASIGVFMMLTAIILGFWLFLFANTSYAQIPVSGGAMNKAVAQARLNELRQAFADEISLKVQYKVTYSKQNGESYSFNVFGSMDKLMAFSDERTIPYRSECTAEGNVKTSELNVGRQIRLTPHADNMLDVFLNFNELVQMKEFSGSECILDLPEISGFSINETVVLKTGTNLVKQLGNFRVTIERL